MTTTRRRRRRRMLRIGRTRSWRTTPSCRRWTSCRPGTRPPSSDPCSRPDRRRWTTEARPGRISIWCCGWHLLAPWGGQGGWSRGRCSSLRGRSGAATSRKPSRRWSRRRPSASSRRTGPSDRQDEAAAAARGLSRATWPWLSDAPSRSTDCAARRATRPCRPWRSTSTHGPTRRTRACRRRSASWPCTSSCARSTTTRGWRAGTGVSARRSAVCCGCRCGETGDATASVWTKQPRRAWRASRWKCWNGWSGCRTREAARPEATPFCVGWEV
ncbi:hypothetical protein VTK73DRAFT_3678 [Phialemonium thermophilum]|uniref:Uncharacterized protein n=1 Tax=Phialemonium thermophilum TaxID=223376 RepID=A0ABR3VG56_9PEZI